MTASPAPISACVPSMAGRTVCRGTVPLNASSNAVAVAPSITASHAPTAEMARIRVGATARAAYISPPTSNAPNTNAAVTPSSGTRRSSRVRLAWRRPMPTAATAGTAHTRATSVDRNPSGMCMAALADADDGEVREARAVAELGRDLRADRVQALRREGLVGAALLARDELVRVDRVQPGPVAEVHMA